MSRSLRQRLRLYLLRGLASFLAPPDPPPPLPAAPRLLLIRPDHLGDLLFCTPALRQLRQTQPQAHLTALVGPWGEPVLAHNPCLDQILSLDFAGFSRRPKPSPWQPYSLLRHQAQRLRGRFDAAYVLRFDHWWGALLAALAGIPRRVGYAVPEVAPFLTHPHPYRPGRHEVIQNLALVSDLASPATHPTPLRSGDWRHAPRNTPPPLEFRPGDAALHWSQEHFGNTAPIAIHPGAGAPVKLWRPAGWAAVADALTRASGAPIILTGSVSERALCQAVAEKMSRPAHTLAGQTDLDQLAALFGRCRLVLGPDSGPLHLATAVGTPTVGLYGPADPALFGPWGPPARHRALTSAWPCVPCGRLDYPPDQVANHPCVRAIDEQQVIAAAQEILN